MIDPALLARPVRDCLAQRLGQSRGSQWGQHVQWASDLPLQQSLALDSIELVDAAEAVSRLFALDLPGWEDYLLRDQSIAGWAAVAAAGLKQYGRVRFRSSGTQGPARESEHQLETLLDEARELAQIFGPRRRVLCAVPNHHIFGFIFGALLPRALAAEPVDFCGLPTSAIGAAAQAGDLVVAHPMLWQRLAESEFLWPADVVGASSSAPLAPAVALRLRELGLARLVEVYGSSETAGIGWRDTAEQSYRVFSRWIIDREGGSSLIDRSGRVYPFPDQIVIDGDGLRPLSRHDQAVQVAGHNVYPEQVAQLLRTHPEVAAVQVRVDVNSGRLKAFVVLGADCHSDADALRRWCQARLSAAEVPTRFDFGTALPDNVMGKPADW